VCQTKNGEERCSLLHFFNPQQGGGTLLFPAALLLAVIFLAGQNCIGQANTNESVIPTKSETKISFPSDVSVLGAKPTPTPTPPVIQPVPSPLTEREQAMLELIKQLQDRVTKLEAKAAATEAGPPPLADITRDPETGVPRENRDAVKDDKEEGGWFIGAIHAESRIQDR
jgi:hypothetical protein